MRKLLFIFALLFCFTACSGQSQQNINIPLIQPLEYVQQPNLSELPEKWQKQLEDYMATLQPRDIISVIRLEQLAESGISLSVTNCKMISAGKATFDVVLENSAGKNVVLPVEALVNFYGNAPELKNIHIIWGNISVDKDSIIFTTLNHIYKLDIHTLDIHQLKPEFLNNQSEWYCLLDTISCDAGYTLAYFGQSQQSIVVFDENGSTTDIYAGGYVFGSTYEDSSNNYDLNFLCQCPTMFYIDPRQTIIGVSSEQRAYEVADAHAVPSTQLLVNLETDEIEHYPFTPFDYTYDNYRVTMFSPGNYNTFRVVRATNGVVTDYFTFDGSDLHETFRLDYDDNFVCSSSADGNIVKIYSPYCGQTVELDFTDYTADSYYQYTSDWDYDVFATDNSGRYELCKGGYFGGGDVSYSQIVLHDTHTGRMKYIDTVGGMYGGSESCGFFSNGDVYTIGLDEFKVFTNDMEQPEPVFEMSKNFPLGSELEGDIYFRHLLAARRNPDDFSWIVLYNEAPYEADANSWYMEDDLGDNFYKSTYKIGILDPQGNLTQVYDTGEHVMTYSFRQVKMYLSEGNILNFEVVIKGTQTQLHGQINLDTGEYTCISGGYNRWNKN